MRFWFLLSLVCGLPLSAQLVTRLHSFANVSPALVEKQIRALVPEGPRVSMNPEAGQVIVIAEDETQEKVASMLRILSTPPLVLRFRIRHNREVHEAVIQDGIPFSVPVSTTPPEDVVELGRQRLLPEQQDIPVVATALQMHVNLLREDPPVARLRVTPAVVFGPLKPHQVVSFDRMSQDLLIDTDAYVDLVVRLEGNDFYRRFLRTLDTTGVAKPVGLLLSFEAERAQPAASGAQNPEEE